MTGSRVAIAMVFTLSVLACAGSAEAQEPPPAYLRAVEPVRSRPDPTALRASAVLFGFSYGLALSIPIGNGFDEQTRWIAVPGVGPFLRPSQLTWGLTLDGLLQLGSVAFFTKAFVSPTRILGPARATGEPEARGVAAGAPVSGLVF